MKIAERIVIVVLFLALFSGGAWLYVSVRQEQQSVRDAVAKGEYEQVIADPLAEVGPDDWQVVYPNTVWLQIGSTSVHASVADSLPERIKGLSDTPFLPKDVVKLFVFGAEGEHSIWMKDMNYPLDIIWVAKTGDIVHIEENVAPETYPESFSSPVPAWYVIEASAGFVTENTISLGDKVVLAE